MRQSRYSLAVAAVLALGTFAGLAQAQQVDQMVWLTLPDDPVMQFLEGGDWTETGTWPKGVSSVLDAREGRAVITVENVEGLVDGSAHVLDFVTGQAWHIKPVYEVLSAVLSPEADRVAVVAQYPITEGLFLFDLLDGAGLMADDVTAKPASVKWTSPNSLSYIPSDSKSIIPVSIDTSEFSDGTGNGAKVYSCGGTNDDFNCGGGNPYPCCSNGGNCTWWAWDRACRNWVQALPGWGNAHSWLGNAGSSRTSTSSGTSRIACDSNNTLSSLGHVAWVTGVSGSTITVSEQNCCTGCPYGSRSYNYNSSVFEGYICASSCGGGGGPSCSNCDGSDGASFVSEGAPYDDTHVNPGQTWTKTWTMRNSGSSYWRKACNHKWAFDGGERFGAAEFTEMGSSECISPGSNKTWSLSMRAPDTPGTYTGYWKMDRYGTGRFGDRVWVRIIVDNPNSCSNCNGSDGASFVSEGGPADGAQVAPGQEFDKSWTMRNTGSSHWRAACNHKWVFDGGEQFGAPSSTEMGSECISPNGTKTWTVRLKAPSTAGTYQGYWRMDRYGTARFGDRVWCKVVVGCTPSITSHPSNRSTCPGGNVSFSVGASVTCGSPSYRWQFNGSDISDGGKYSGTGSSTLSVSNVDSSVLGNYRCRVTGVGASVTSNQASLSYDGTSISSHPSSSTICPGQSANFSVSASGCSLSYRWQFNGNDISDGGKYSGTGTSTLTVSNADSGVVGAYRCRVSGANGSPTSNSANLAFHGTSITTHPTAQTVCPGASVNFNVAASGCSPSYQWQLNGVNISNGGKYSGVNTTTLTVSSVDASVAGNYRCVVTGGGGTATSNNANLGIHGITTITAHPVSRIDCPYATVNFSVTATGANLTYQWQFNGSNISNGGMYSGVNTATLTIANIDTPAIGEYRCLVGGTCGSATSNSATLGIDAGIIQVNTHPTPQGGCPGSTVNFTVTGSGCNLTYQWLFNGSSIANGGKYSGAQSATLTVAGIDAGVVGDYSCRLTASGGTVTSDPAALSIHPLTEITAQPVSRFGCPGGIATFSVAANGVSLAYQWKFNGSNLDENGKYSGTQTATLTISDVDASVLGQYSCAITGGCGNVTSTAATLTLGAGTIITENPQALQLCPGTTANFTAAATGEGTVSYRWAKDGTPLDDNERIAGANTPALSIADLVPADAGDYTCVATASCGDTTSTAANLLVKQATTVTEPPADAAACPGDTTEFSATAIGVDLAYQWQVDTGTGFANIDGATESSYTTLPAELEHDGYRFRVAVTGECGNVESEPATLEVRPVTTITQQPESTNLCTGANVDFTVAATGYGTLTYQWQHNQVDMIDGERVSGADTPNLILTGVTLEDAGGYRCVVTGGCRQVASDEATLALEASTEITSQPTDYTACVSYPARFAVQAIGPQLVFQWQVSTGGAFVDVDGANTAAYTTAGVVVGDNGKQFRCIVSGPCGTVTSDTVTLTVSTATTPGAYTIVDLGTLGGSESQAMGLNSSGDVVGWSYTANDAAKHAFFYRDGVMQDLGTLGGDESMAYDVNNDGVVVGWSQLPDGTRHAFKWVDGLMSDLGTLGGTTSEAYGINDGGEISGMSTLDGDAIERAFKHTGTEMLDLGALGGSSKSVAYSINDSGWTAGASTFGESPAVHGFRLDGSSMVDLGTFAGAESISRRINVAGQVVGSAQMGDGAWRAFIYTGGAKGNIGTLGGRDSSAEGLNDLAQVVGWSLLADETTKVAMLYRFGTRYDLNNMIAACPDWSLESAQANNNVGQIVGYGAIDGAKRGFLLTPNPVTLLATQQPQDLLTCPGATATFQVTVTGGGTKTYKWQKDHVDLVNGGDISGATTATLQIANLDNDDLGQYRCYVAAGSYKLYTRPAQLTLAGGVSITQQPESVEFCRRYVATFTVAAEGPELTYQWQKDAGGGFQDIPGADQPSYRTPPVEAVDNGHQFRCVVGSTCGQAISEPAILTVTTLDTTKSYVVIDLGTLGGDESKAYGINSSGQVVGVAKNADGQNRAFLYSGGRMIDLGTLGGDESHAAALNGAGKVVGWANLPDDSKRAFIYANGTMQDLGTLGGINSAASAINSGGTVVGWSEIEGGAQRGFVYDPATATMTALSTLGGDDGQANAINDSGRVVGGSLLGGGNQHGYTYDGNYMIDVGTFGGPASVCNWINPAGQVVGTAQMGDGSWRAFIYTGGAKGNLGTLGGTNSCANAINSTAQVVGWSDLAGDTARHAFMYRLGTRTDLNTLIPNCPSWELLDAQGINDKGQIVGHGIIDGQSRAFVMTPLLSSDFDRDGDVDQGDFGHFQQCVSGANIPLAAGCDNADLDNDNDVDLSDFGILQRCVSGPNGVVNLYCTN